MADDTHLTHLTRTVETDLSPDDLWSLVADRAGWATWLVDEADVTVRPGATGTVVDDGEARDVRIDSVEPHERVAFTWWPQGRTEQATTVELVVIPGRLLITETHRQSLRGVGGDPVGRASARAVLDRPGRRARVIADRRPLDELFGVLADPTRREVLERLVHDGPQTATALAAHFPTTRQAIVKHLKVLADAGLVAPERVGREVRYVATTERLADAVTWLLDASRRWDRRVARLGADHP